jgi:hypothetical protein
MLRRHLWSDEELQSVLESFQDSVGVLFYALAPEHPNFASQSCFVIYRCPFSTEDAPVEIFGGMKLKGQVDVGDLQRMLNN